MTDLEKFNEIVDDIWEMVFGTKRRPEKETRMMKKEKSKRKRARKADGTYRGDDKSTPDVNEAWENE